MITMCSILGDKTLGLEGLDLRRYSVLLQFQV